MCFLQGLPFDPADTQGPLRQDGNDATASTAPQSAILKGLRRESLVAGSHFNGAVICAFYYYKREHELAIK